MGLTVGIGSEQYQGGRQAYRNGLERTDNPNPYPRASLQEQDAREQRAKWFDWLDGFNHERQSDLADDGMGDRT